MNNTVKLFSFLFLFFSFGFLFLYQSSHQGDVLSMFNVLFALFFSFAISLLMVHSTDKRIKKMMEKNKLLQLDLLPGETIVAESISSYKKNKLKQEGGKLFLTDKRLCFIYSHLYFSEIAIELEKEEIKEVNCIGQKKLFVVDKKGKQYEFCVESNDEFYI